MVFVCVVVSLGWVTPVVATADPTPSPKASGPHAFKEDYVGAGSVSKFDIKMGPNGELHLANKDGSIVIPTGIFPER